MENIKALKMELGDRSYGITVGPGLLGKAAELFSPPRGFFCENKILI